MDFVLLYGFLAVLLSSLIKWLVSVVSGHGANLRACVFVFPLFNILASPDDLSIFLPLHLTEWYKTSPCLMQMHSGSVILRWVLTIDCCFFLLQVQNLCSANPQLLSVDQVFHNFGCCKGYGFPLNYAVHMAGLWAVPGVWSCFMTSCPRAREGACPFPVRTVQTAWTLGWCTNRTGSYLIYFGPKLKLY